MTGWLINNWKKYGRQKSWPILMFYPSITPKELRKNKKP
jgi:hypothetical protein